LHAADGWWLTRDLSREALKVEAGEVARALGGDWRAGVDRHGTPMLWRVHPLTKQGTHIAEKLQPTSAAWCALVLLARRSSSEVLPP
jgi:hypothetical protein